LPRPHAAPSRITAALTASADLVQLRGTALHAREEAMFALDVQNDPKRALELARLNVRLQREPIDLLVFARAASAANDIAARGEVKALMQQIGLKDARVDATP
jgi:hypothetical protein